MPLLDLALLRNRVLVGSTIAILIGAGTINGLMYLLSLYFQDPATLGFSPLQAGLATLPATVGLVVVAPLVPRLAARFGGRQTIGVGFALTDRSASSSWASSHASWTYAAFLLPLVAIAVGMGLSNGPASSAATASVPENQVGGASGVSNMARYVGAAVATALAATIYGTVITNQTADGHSKGDALASGLAAASWMMAVFSFLGVADGLVMGRGSGRARARCTTRPRRPRPRHAHAADLGDDRGAFLTGDAREPAPSLPLEDGAGAPAAGSCVRQTESAAWSEPLSPTSILRGLALSATGTLQPQHAGVVARLDAVEVEVVAEHQLAAEQAAWAARRRASPSRRCGRPARPGRSARCARRRGRCVSRRTPGRSNSMTKVSPSRQASIGITAGRLVVPAPRTCWARRSNSRNGSVRINMVSTSDRSSGSSQTCIGCYRFYIAHETVTTQVGPPDRRRADDGHDRDARGVFAISVAAELHRRGRPEPARLRAPRPGRAGPDRGRHPPLQRGRPRPGPADRWSCSRDGLNLAGIALVLELEADNARLRRAAAAAQPARARKPS